MCVHESADCNIPEVYGLRLNNNRWSMCCPDWAFELKVLHKSKVPEQSSTVLATSHSE